MGVITVLPKKRGAKKGGPYNLKDKYRMCVVCNRQFFCTGNAKYCWDHKKI